MRELWYVIGMLFIITTGGYAQNSVENIRKLREKTVREIEYANKILAETKGQTKQSLQEVNIINEKLKRRKEYITSLEAEASLLGNNIADCESSISHLENNIGNLKSSYAKILVKNYKVRAQDYYYLFLLAADNVNQMYQRFRFVRIYMNYIRMQKLKLERLRADIVVKTSELQQSKKEKERLVISTKREYAMIRDESAKKLVMLHSLKEKQGEIEKEIKEKERIASKLDREITKIIESERIKPGKGNKRIALTPVELVISSDFGKNQGKLPWPTQKGIISGTYGEHEHPDFKSVKIRNDGIYISTEKGEFVRAVFKGVVSKVFSIPGENYTVILKHGNYYTLYHNIIDVTVKAGQHVDTREVIGKVFTDNETKETTLYFQVWKETERNDPEIWLAH